MKTQLESTITLAQPVAWSQLPLSLTVARKAKVILIVDDTASTRTFLAFHLQQAGYTVWTAASSAEALAQVEQHGLPHLVLIDVQLAGRSGVILAEWLQQQGPLPVIFLGAPPDLALAPAGAKLLGKPVQVSQLTAQVQQALPDALPSPEVCQEQRVDERLTLNFVACYAILDRHLIPLTLAENALLCLLFQHRGQVVPYQMLHEKLGEVEPSSRRSPMTYIYYLRQKLEAHQAHRRYIRTVAGQGYFMPLIPVDRQPPVPIVIPRRTHSRQE